MPSFQARESRSESILFVVKSVPEVRKGALRVDGTAEMSAPSSPPSSVSSVARPSARPLPRDPGPPPQHGAPNRPSRVRSPARLPAPGRAPRRAALAVCAFSQAGGGVSGGWGWGKGGGRGTEVVGLCLILTGGWAGRGGDEIVRKRIHQSINQSITDLLVTQRKKKAGNCSPALAHSLTRSLLVPPTTRPRVCFYIMSPIQPSSLRRSPPPRARADRESRQRAAEGGKGPAAPQAEV